MKYVALRCFEQWTNFKEYILNFLPNPNNFKSEISKTQRYIRTKKVFEKPLTEASVSFCAFMILSLLLPLLTGEPIIHLLHSSMCYLLHDLYSKLGKKKISR